MILNGQVYVKGDSKLHFQFEINHWDALGGGSDSLYDKCSCYMSHSDETSHNNWFTHFTLSRYLRIEPQRPFYNVNNQLTSANHYLNWNTNTSSWGP